MQITIQLTMLNGALNIRGRPSVKTLVLRSNTPKHPYIHDTRTIQEQQVALH